MRVAVVAGYAIRFPLGGMTWVYLHHLLGLRALGFHVVYVEAALWEGSCYDPADDAMTDDPSAGIAHLRRGAAAAGLTDLDVVWYGMDGSTAGIERAEADALLERAPVLVNVGASTWHDSWRAVSRRILVDCDAPFTQIAIHRGVEPLAGIARNHDVWATLGRRVAAGECEGIPLDRPWIATRPPVHTPAWPLVDAPDDGPWSTVTSWGSAARDEWNGVALGNKADGYEQLLDLPRGVRVPLELAVASDAPAADLGRRGWRVVDPVPRSDEAATFAGYVRSSRGELAVAKAAYSTVRTGAMNDRSLAYLASGRPVVCSDVGLDRPATGPGLLTFNDPSGAAAAIRAVEDEYELHAAAARRIAEEHEAATVVAELLAAADVTLPTGVVAP